MNRLEIFQEVYGKGYMFTETELIRLHQVAELIVKECVEKIETYEIPVGNSSVGEMACEWTYASLKEIRNDIKEHFGIESE